MQDDAIQEAGTLYPIALRRPFSILCPKDGKVHNISAIFASKSESVNDATGPVVDVNTLSVPVSVCIS